MSKFIISKQIVNNYKISHKEKPKKRLFYQWFLPNALRIIIVSSSQNLPKREEWVTLSNLFHEVNTTLRLKTKTSHKTYRLISFINFKNSQQSTGKLNSIAHRKDYTLWPSGLHPWNATYENKLM